MKICRITRETSCKLRNTNSSPTFPYISAYVNEEKKKKKEKAWGTELMYFIFAKIKGKWNSTRIYLIWTRSARFDGGNFMRSILFKKLNLVLFLGYLFILYIYYRNPGRLRWKGTPGSLYSNRDTQSQAHVQAASEGLQGGKLYEQSELPVPVTWHPHSAEVLPGS